MLAYSVLMGLAGRADSGGSPRSIGDAECAAALVSYLGHRVTIRVSIFSETWADGGPDIRALEMKLHRAIDWPFPRRSAPHWGALKLRAMRQSNRRRASGRWEMCKAIQLKQLSFLANDLPEYFASP